MKQIGEIVMIQTTKDNTVYHIAISPLPKNCDACPFRLKHEDDEYGGYNYEYCQFGAKDNFGVVLHRASDCPL